jgi:hypothetical protein
MIASYRVTSETGAIAHVHFRVRCERLGHGEEVFLVQEGDTKMQKVRDVTSAKAVLRVCAR